MRDVAVIGIGLKRFGEHWKTSLRDLFVESALEAIDDAGEGGGFVLSTADQTPRDTPDENIIAMQRVAETYGKY